MDARVSAHVSASVELLSEEGWTENRNKYRCETRSLGYFILLCGHFMALVLICRQVPATALEL